MTTAAIVLVLCSAILHAGWNAFSKQSGPSTALFFIIAMFGAFLTTPIALLNWEYLSEIPIPVLYRLIATGFFQAVYFIGLAGAYRHGHMSIAYPIARAVPVVLVAFAVFLFSNGETFTFPAVLGMACVVIGCVLIPMLHMRDLRLANYMNLSLAYALCAAAGTTGYTLIDDSTLRLLHEDPAWPLSNTRTATLYMAIESWACFLWLVPIVLCSRVRRVEVHAVWKNQKKPTAANAVFMLLSYGMILTSYTLATNVGYIAAFRQAAIPIGAAIGIMWFREPLTRPKSIGLIMLIVGLILVALF